MVQYLLEARRRRRSAIDIKGRSQLGYCFQRTRLNIPRRAKNQHVVGKGPQYMIHIIRMSLMEVWLLMHSDSWD